MLTRLLTFLYAILTLVTPLPAELLDLERDLGQDFVLATKQIHVPGYPDAFNPSIIPWNESWLMSFRTGSSHEASDSDPFVMSFRIRDPLTACTNLIGLVLLNKNFDPVSKPQILEISYDHPQFAFRQQDPRLITIGERVYIVYSNMIEGVEIPEIRRMFVTEVFFDGRRFFTGQPTYLSQFEGENESRWQKNWVPFCFDGQLLLAYSINPHRILFPNLATGECPTLAYTKGKIQWDWGVLRGGTPALLDGDKYLGFFHSSKPIATTYSEGKKMDHYVMGAYTFSANPPFGLETISPEPIVGENFYTGPVHKTWKPLRVVFPGGFVFDKNYVWVVYGRQDHESWVAKLDKKKLLESLVPVSCQD